MPAPLGAGAGEVFAEDRRVPHGFDVLDDQLRAARVADEGASAGIVHGVGQVAGEDDFEAKAGHLPGAKAAVQDADVGVDAHQHDLVDALLLAEVVDRLPAFAHAVEADDVEGGNLAGPGVGRAGLFPTLPDH